MTTTSQRPQVRYHHVSWGSLPYTHSSGDRFAYVDPSDYDIVNWSVFGADGETIVHGSERDLSWPRDTPATREATYQRALKDALSQLS